VKSIAVLSVGLGCLWCGIAGADVRLPKLMSDHMVLQRDMAAPVWGWAEPGEEVTVALAGQAAAATAGADGRWLVTLGPLPAGGPHELVIRGNNQVTLKDVLIGEVWLCSGQSNLIFRVGENTGGREVAGAADYPRIRFFVVDRDVASKPLDDVADGPAARWVPCSPKTAGGFSAVGYFFGRDIHTSLDVPVGLIQSGVTDTRAEFYMSPKALAADPDFAIVYQRWAEWKTQHNLDADFPDIEQNMHEVYHDQRPMRSRWQEAAAIAKAAGQEPPPEPRYLPWRIFKNYPSGQYNAHIHPLMPYGIRGVVWYQGEGNATAAQLYRKLLPAMIRNWRADWHARGGQDDFAFLILQLPWIEPPRAGWEELREAQFMTHRRVANTGLAVTYDIPITGDILHPPQKEPFGRRLGTIALGMVYGRDVAYQSPLYREAVREGAGFRIRFDHAEGGLSLRPGTDDTLKGFIIAGEDQRFRPATARIDGDTVVVASPDVARPQSVRYAWSSNPDANLVNAAGLPAAPFRLDDWPGVTSRDVTDYSHDPAHMAWVIERYTSWGMLDDAAGHLPQWGGDPMAKAGWVRRVAAAYRDAGRAADARRVVQDALVAAGKIQDPQLKERFIASITNDDAPRNVPDEQGVHPRTR
jgi:sialate O-acetylesterase